MANIFKIFSEDNVQPVDYNQPANTQSPVTNVDPQAVVETPAVASDPVAATPQQPQSQATVPTANNNTNSPARNESADIISDIADGTLDRFSHSIKIKSMLIASSQSPQSMEKEDIIEKIGTEGAQNVTQQVGMAKQPEELQNKLANLRAQLSAENKPSQG